MKQRNHYRKLSKIALISKKATEIMRGSGPIVLPVPPINDELRMPSSKKRTVIEVAQSQTLKCDTTVSRTARIRK